jgi:hypothetical protein
MIWIYMILRKIKLRLFNVEKYIYKDLLIIYWDARNWNMVIIVMDMVILIMVMDKVKELEKY